MSMISTVNSSIIVINNSVSMIFQYKKQVFMNIDPNICFIFLNESISWLKIRYKFFPNCWMFFFIFTGHINFIGSVNVLPCLFRSFRVLST